MEKKDLIMIRESTAEIYVHNSDKDSIPSKSMNVFYNKKMEINRDISNLAIMAYNELYNPDKLIIIDSMAGTGIGSIRMIKECQNIQKIYINDINPLAVELIHKNISINNLNNSQIRIIISRKDANFLFSKIAQKNRMNSEIIIKKPNIISIDPFGTPNLYLDSAFKAIQRVNGLMCVTATDTAVLFGIKPTSCIRKYMSKPLHTEYCKEVGARILIYLISRMANINGMGIFPLLTFYANHFIRVFCLTLKNKHKISNSFENYGYIVHCRNCNYRKAFKNNPLQFLQECPSCNTIEKMDYTGPLWVDQMHDKIFINKLIDLNENCGYYNKKRIHKLLKLASDEINMPISYYNLHKLCQKLNLPYVPKIGEIIQIIKKKGYKVSRTHFDYLSIKTNMDLKSLKNCLLEFKN
ncbi:MAG: tRNA (guanine(10)-N(2))-dimethyltransferase [Promethearchaeota archaeon]